MRVVVVGAGISGVAAAHALRQQAPEIAVTVLDGAAQIGGKLRTSEIVGKPVDEGAEAFVLRAPEGVELARLTGLADQLVSAATTSAGLVVDGELRALPAGSLLGIPTQAGPIGSSLGEDAALAVTAEP
ncbi:MAG: NAD(P)-binding protein, partial [Micromonosporaceae bacterium]